MIRVPIFTMIIIFYCINIDSQYHAQVKPITSGYGSDSTLFVKLDSIRGESWRRKSIYIYYPDNVEIKLPVIFFLHGMGSSERNVYEHLLRHIACRGFCVIMPSYNLASFPYQGRTYRKLFSNIVQAVRCFEDIIDTTRIGFAGHSFGAGAIPSMVWQCLSNRKWGKDGTFMFLMAPFFMFEISQKQLDRFPQHVKLLIEVYEEDDCNDHRIAKDIFESINIPTSEKDFIIMQSDSNIHSGYKLVAGHGAPYSDRGIEGKVDAMDYYGIYRLFDALADYTFTNSVKAKEIALGNGSEIQRFMGIWPDDRPVKNPIVSDDPILIRPRESYYFHWKHPWNPRRRKKEYPDEGMKEYINSQVKGSDIDKKP